MTDKIEHEGRAAGPLPSFRLDVIKTRAEFKAASGGPRFSTPGFTMLRRPLPVPPAGARLPLRFGFTVTKKVGNAVERNRIRRRLREAVRRAGTAAAVPGMDLVILARRAAIDLPFTALVEDIRRAMLALAAKGEARKKPQEAGKPPET